ncbi:MAG: SDR family oxidoreductase [Candidatus Bathyarchaeota archaeon]|nr:MAG: SDR family oxidoreductase [Candidatus Bathyarchaeota archaeon]
MKRLDGKVTLVTGSGRGFGRSVALAYALEGARVVSVARTLSELEQTEDIINARGGEVLTVPTDLSYVREIRGLVGEVLETFGRLDALFNNAAMSSWKTLDEMTVDDWDRTIAVNLRAPFLLAKGFMGAMREQGGGSIVNVTSASAVKGFVAETAYCPSKYGLEGLTQCLALELKQHNIAVNTLGVAAPPGKALKPTSLTQDEADGMPEEVRARYADEDSMVEAFRDAWAFVALQDGGGVTGQRLSTRQLAEDLERDGWEATASRLRGKLTRVVYKPYEFPKSARYQTPDGGWKELRFD